MATTYLTWDEFVSHRKYMNPCGEKELEPFKEIVLPFPEPEPKELNIFEVI